MKLQSACAAERILVDRLRSGDQAVFLELADSHHDSLLSLARLCVSTPALA